MIVRHTWSDSFDQYRNTAAWPSCGRADNCDELKTRKIFRQIAPGDVGLQSLSAAAPKGLQRRLQLRHLCPRPYQAYFKHEDAASATKGTSFMLSAQYMYTLRQDRPSKYAIAIQLQESFSVPTLGLACHDARFVLFNVCRCASESLYANCSVYSSHFIHCDAEPPSPRMAPLPGPTPGNR